MFIDERTQNRLHAVPGESISHGTMRTQDLIPAFLDVIRDTPEYVQVMNAIPAHAMEDKEADWWNSDDAAGLLESLFDTLDSYSPVRLRILENGQVNVGTWYGLQKTSGMTFSKTGFVSGKSILPVPKAGN